MKILLASDNTVPLNLARLADKLNAQCTQLRFDANSRNVRVPDAEISYSTYTKLNREYSDLANDHAMTVVATFAPYHNNHFFDAPGKLIIVSFNEWHSLTDLPLVNGLVYFIASIVADEIKLGSTHDENTGCLNDYWWDKRGVDVGMRAAYVCRACRGQYRGRRELADDVQRLLDAVSTASRSGTDLLASANDPTAPNYDVFLCHSSSDKPLIRQINSALRLAGVVTWFDEEQLKPAQLWQVELERQIELVRAACVFAGDNSRGPWQDMEIRAFITEFVRRQCAVIPVLLPTATSTPELPIFLRQFQWVDLRKEYDFGLAAIAKAVRADYGSQET